MTPRRHHARHARALAASCDHERDDAQGNPDAATRNHAHEHRQAGKAHEPSQAGHAHHGDLSPVPGPVADGSHPSRRRLLAGAGALVGVALAGCPQLGDTETVAPPEPITLTTEDSCEVCGMVIPNHPGPSVEIFYAENTPAGHDNPAHFDSTKEAFQYHFDRLDRNWRATGFYVTDYSSVAYSLSTTGGDTLISTHPEASAFVDAHEVTFVVGSDVKGAMGRDLIGFAAEADASAFADDHGGSLATFDEVTPETIAQLSQS